MIDRRTFVAAGAALAASAPFAAQRPGASAAFPDGFLWGVATAGHQIEGNNIASDLWLLENIKPTAFAEPSGDALNSFELWRQDLDLVKSLGLNSYRFSIEWARIEPEPGRFSLAMLDHYKAMIDGCRERGLTPLVTFNHFTAPRWFAAQGGWLNAGAPGLFGRYCERAARHLAAGIGYAVTFNEPNLLQLLRILGLPPFVLDAQRAMLAAAAQATQTERFVALNAANWEDLDHMLPNLLAGHRVAKQAIKSARSDLPVGVSLAMLDDQESGRESIRDAKRRENYAAWLDVAGSDDFLGVQNYERALWGSKGRLPPPKNATLNWSGAEIHAPSLAGAVRFAHQAAQRSFPRRWPN
jgi:beta-glucosidase